MEFNNLLTVIASESYRNFVTDLQSDIKTVLYDRPTVATSEYFNGKYVKVNDVPTLIDKTAADTIEFYLISNGYVDMKRKIKKLFNELSTCKVKYHDVDSYQSLLNIMNTL